jgi:hypothetical protein
MRAAEVSQVRWARLAGFLYMFTYVVPITGWTITGNMEGSGSFAEAAHRIVGAELWYRFGLSCLLLNWLLCILLAMGLYVALKPVNSTLALFGLLFRVVENVLAIGFAIVSLAMVKAYTGGEMLAAFSAKQLAAGVGLLAHAGQVQFNVSMIFLGIGSGFFYYLLVKSGYIPKVLAVYSLWTCPVFVAASAGFLFWPQYAARLQWGWYPLALAEMLVGLWLLVKGVKVGAVGVAGGEADCARQ